MSFPNPGPPFSAARSQPYSVGSDAIGVWPQNPLNNERFDLQPPSKRPRNHEENQSNPALNSPITKRAAHIFFKTRVCAKFKQGMCRNGENCNFAHGLEDLRQPPPDWQELVGSGGGRVEKDGLPGSNWGDDQNIIHKMKLCKKFCNGEICPYGDRCNFLHGDSWKYRESSAISIGTTGPTMVTGNNTTVKPVYWKTKVCSKWTIGQCPFGEKCHFAHGEAELQVIGGQTEGEEGNAGFIPTKPQFIAANGAAPPPSKPATSPTSSKEVEGKKSLLKLKGAKKINRIYADWLDDMPLPVHNLPNQVES